MSKNKNIQQKKSKLSFDNDLIWLIIIVILTFLAYFPVFNADITNWDDNRYIDENPLLMNFGWDSLKLIFSTFFMGHYHPLTMISIAFDHFIFNNSPAGYHFVNLLFHIINSILVFKILSKLLKDIKVSVIASLLFAIHPMHVESVAWISERKDVLFSLFYLLSILFYINFSDRSKNKWYLLTFLTFILACLSKSAAITLPLSLLLIDYLKERPMNKTAVYFEKIPFLILSLLFGILSIYANKPLEVETEAVILSWGNRLLYSSYGFVLYLFKLVFPLWLSAWYPYPSGQYFYFFASVAVFIIVGSGYVLFSWFRNNRIVVFSVFFFIVNILLVLQIFPARSTVIAERYTYIPSLTFFLLLAYFFHKYTEHTKRNRNTATTILVIYIAILTITTFNRSRVWKDSLSLWENVLERNPDVPVALNNLGLAKTDLGMYAEAISGFDKLISLKPEFTDAYVNRGYAREKLGDSTGALQDYSKAIELEPENIFAYSNRAMLWSDMNDSNDAFKDINFAIRKHPKEPMLYRNLGLIYIKFNMLNDGLKQLSTAISLNKNYSLAYENRGFIMHQTGKYEEAIADYNKAIKISPRSAETYFNRAASWFKLGRKNYGCKDLKKSSELGYQRATELYSQYCGSE